MLCYVIGLLVVQTPIVGLYVARLLAQGLATPSSLMEALQPSQLPLWLDTALKGAELLMVIAFTYLLGRLIDHRAFAGFGFHLTRGWLGDIALGLALGAGQMAFIVAVEWAGGWLTVGRPTAAALIKGTTDAAFAVILFASVAVGEELIFRGYVQTNLREGSGPAIALVLSSILFGLFHSLNPNITWLGWLNIALAGVAMGYGYLATGNLWLPIGYHFTWNFFQGPILGLPVSGVRYGGLLTAVDRGMAPWITGGAFGPEGGAIGTLVLLSSFPIIWWWKQEQARFFPGG
jgi:membrane protease YdiL (CAAX protease family)